MTEQVLPALGRAAWRDTALFALTVFVSAFLLFQVQPLVSKQILPWFGGSPAVWTAAMLFFQTLLFAGYVYSHLLTQRLPARTQAWCHLALLAAASVLAWYVLPEASARASISDQPLLSILLILATSAGLPYLCLATTAPLVQYWFSRQNPGQSPYRLYSLSNAGSLIALLSFPYLFEPALELPQIGRLWTGLFWLFAVLCAVLAWRARTIVDIAPASTLSATRMTATTTAITAGTHVGHRPTVARRVTWVALPALGSLLFIATTDHVSHDIAPEPRVWIATLSLYLLTFIICFDHARWYRRGWVAAACLLGVLAITSYKDLPEWLGFSVNLDVTGIRTFHLAVMFLGCFLCHGELYQTRPTQPRYMTEFYLWISFGGAMGGLFVALVCTHVFDDYYEWSLSLIGAVALAVLVLFSERWRRRAAAHREGRQVALAGCAIAALAAWILYFEDPLAWRDSSTPEVTEQRLHQSRNFYGSVTVSEFKHRSHPLDDYRIFYSGDVVHGLQFTDPSRRRLPVSYHSEKSGVGETLLYAAERQPSLRVAIVGLGAGTLATYARPADAYDFYEINPTVVDVAEELFTNVKDCQAHEKRMILGDARLKMEQMPADVLYDVIALDAFTGSSVPVHLMTREAFEIYRRHLKPDGFIVVNITNRHLNLYPVARLQAEALNMGYRYNSAEPEPDKQIRRSRHFIITNDQAYLKRFPSVYRRYVDAAGNQQTEQPDISGITLWTDHFSSISPIQRRD